MAPLILHNVPDEELYVGDDGIKRPYAMVFPQQDGHAGGSLRSRRGPETGSFGKSTRRSRSRTGTPAKRENPTIQAADKLFSDFVNKLPNEPIAAPAARKIPSSTSQPTLLTQTLDDAGATSQTHPAVASVPTEVILRGYRSSTQQYAAINHYEELAGLICEDYPRDPPADQRRYKSELRDPAYTRRQRALTAAERAKVSRAAGGDHWVKVTFESAEAADRAVSASPQRILGHRVYADLWAGRAPRDEAAPDDDPTVESFRRFANTMRTATPAGPPADAGFGAGRLQRRRSQHAAVAAAAAVGNDSPQGSRVSSQTMDTGTIAPSDSSATVTGTDAAQADQQLQQQLQQQQQQQQQQNRAYCRRVPNARRVQLRPVEQALLPQPSYAQRALSHIPFLQWFSGSMIGNEVPRTDSGEFDWDRASLYWKIIWWLDATFGLFGGEILSADKDD